MMYKNFVWQQMHWRVHSLNCTQNSLSSAEHPQPSSSDNSQTQVVMNFILNFTVLAVLPYKGE